MSHHGVSFIGIARALLVNLTERRYAQGGSTITQQLMRCLYLTNRKTLFRKALEIVLALLYELRFSKANILFSYMRNVYMGHTGSGRPIVGMFTAAWAYFKKPMNKLTLAEVAALVAMLRGPNLYRKDSSAGIARRILVLSRLLDAGAITQAEFFEASKVRF